MIITALNRYYKRLDKEKKVPKEGFSKEKISYAIVLSEKGKAVDVNDIRDSSGKKAQPKLLAVPQPPKRSANVAPAFLWGDSKYVLGVAGGEKKKDRTLKCHEAFRDKMLETIKDSTDRELLALQKFLQTWSPEKFTEPPFDNNEQFLDQNFVFVFDGNKQKYLHDQPSAGKLWLSQLREKDNKTIGRCLVTGKNRPIARLHPSIKGVRGAQSIGASIVSFNLSSFESYNKRQGNNSPVSELVANQYTKALNYLLSKGSNQSLVIGDTTAVFWALAENSSSADKAEGLLGGILNPSTDEQETSELQKMLSVVSKGRPLKEFNSDLDLDPDTRVFILGLSPNSSRLSIRFWQTGSLDFFARKIYQHYRDLKLKPLAWKTPPSIWRLLQQTAPSRKGKHDSKDILPHLAGEIMRAIISGRNYPYSLLTTIVMRMRTDGDISDLRIALIKAVITRKMRINNNKEELPVSLDKNCDNPGYQLGRWFAELENAQQSALEDAKTTIKDQYYGSASANPAATFPTLIRKYHNHISKLDRDKKGWAVIIEKNIGEIVDKLPSEFPNTLTIEDQGRFAIGYYHQRSLRFTKKEDKK